MYLWDVGLSVGLPVLMSDVEDKDKTQRFPHDGTEDISRSQRAFQPIERWIIFITDN